MEDSDDEEHNLIMVSASCARCRPWLMVKRAQPATRSRLRGSEQAPVRMLPDMLLGEIFKQIRLKRRSFTSHALVCREWHSIFKGNQDEIRIRKEAWVDEDSLINELSSYPSLTSLIFEKHSVWRLSDNLLKFLSTRPLLRRLEIRPEASVANSYAFTVKGLKQLYQWKHLEVLALLFSPDGPRALPPGIEALSQLRSCAIGDPNPRTISGLRIVQFPSSVPEGLWSMTNLRRLQISQGWLMSCPPHIRDIMRLSYLEILDYKQSGWPRQQVPYTDEEIEAMALRQRDLKSLSISVSHLTALSTLAVLSRMTKLDVLTFGQTQDSTEAFKGLSALQNLRIKCEDPWRALPLPASITRLRSLRTLRLGFTLRGRFPAGFECLSNLEELDAPDAALEDFLACIPANQHAANGGPSEVVTAFPQLMRLRLRLGYAEELDPLLFKFRQLRQITLRHCDRLFALPENISSFTALQALELHSCVKLQRIPETIGSLSSLKTLILHGCSLLATLPDALGLLKSLEKVSVRNYFGSSSLASLPDSVSALQSLKEAELELATSAAQVPSALGKITSLEVLRLEAQRISAWPESLCGLPCLRHLHVNHNFEMGELPESISQLSALQALELSKCYALRCLPETVGLLSRLTKLCFSDCPRLTDLPASLPGLTNLKELKVSYCSCVTDISIIAQCSSLMHLTLDHLLGIRALPDSISELRALRVLRISELRDLTELPPALSRMTGLVDLDVHGCSSLMSLPEAIRGLPRLAPSSKQQLTRLAGQVARRKKSPRGTAAM